MDFSKTIYEVLATPVVKAIVACDVTPCSLVERQ